VHPRPKGPAGELTGAFPGFDENPGLSGRRLDPFYPGSQEIAPEANEVRIIPERLSSQHQPNND